MSVKLVRLGVLLSFLMAGTVVFAQPENPPTDEITVQSSLPPVSVHASETIAFDITFEWRGGEDRYRFLIPDIPTTNLELLGVSQSIKTKDGGVNAKTFGFRFKALEAGKAEIRPFHFFYLLHDATVPLQKPIPTAKIQILPDSISIFRQPAWLMLLGGTAGLLLAGFLLLKKRGHFSKEVPDNSYPNALSLEAKSIRELVQLREMQDQTDSASDLLEASSRIFLTYGREKFGISTLEDFDREPKPKYPLHPRPKEEFKRLILMIQSYRFSGESLDRRNVFRLIDALQSFIRQLEIIEPSHD